MVKSKVYTPLMIGDNVPIVVMVLGGVIGFVGVFCSAFLMFKVRCY